MPNESIYDILKREHKVVAGLLTELDDTNEDDHQARESLFAKLQEELLLHAKAEELVFYKPLREQEDSRAISLEAVEEHRVVTHLLTELDRMQKTNERWGAKLAVLKENVEHHVEEEEGELFTHAKKVLSKEEALAIGEAFLAAKTQLKRELNL